MPESSSPPRTLRPYQIEALDELATHFFEEGLNRLLVEHPTGLGKTVLAAGIQHHRAFRRWLDSFPPDERRILFLAHRRELLNQARETFSSPVGHNGYSRQSTRDNVVFASVPAFGRKGSPRLKELRPEAFRIVIVDEAHHAVAPSYRRILDHFGFSTASSGTRSVSDRLLVGLSATPTRADAIALNTQFDAIAHALPLFEMIEDGHLAPLRAFQVRTAVSLEMVQQNRDDFDVASLAALVNTPERNTAAVRAVLDLASDRRTLVFAVNVAHAKALAAAYCEAGLAAEAVHGSLSADDRAGVLARFRQGTTQVLANCMVLTEGFDEPSVSCVVLARPTRSPVLYRQMIGRGTRRSEGKNDCLLVDLLDSTTVHDLQSMGTLLGLPAQFGLDGRDAAQVRRRVLCFRQQHGDVAIPQDAGLADLDLMLLPVKLWRLSDETAGWVRVDQSTRILGVESDGLERLVARRKAGQWSVTRVRWPKLPPLIDGFRLEWRWFFPTPLPSYASGPFSSSRAAERAVARWLRDERSKPLPRQEKGGLSGPLLADRNGSFWSDGDRCWRPTARFKGARTCLAAVPGSVLLGHADKDGAEVFGQLVFDNEFVAGYVRMNAGEAFRQKVFRVLSRFEEKAPDACRLGLPYSQNDLGAWYVSVRLSRDVLHYQQMLTKANAHMDSTRWARAMALNEG